ncbi:peptidylprolyl isomerase [Candidatus Magnetaquicoccus inordinatus]|uniref:peptidylprolyl isomerase n=1 Tax=Candidatus Magnetaquicoccus inordinatus TaxID=2496818 RepID=UPI00187D33E7|nr:peptidylprolyl isomerase [Candidatus Magnetaquicoccus inordinatus]
MQNIRMAKSTLFSFLAMGCLAHATLFQPAVAAEREENIVAEMGDARLSKAQLQSLLAALPTEKRQAILSNQNLLARLVQEEVIRLYLLQEARKSGLDKKAEVATAMRQASEQILLNQYVVDQVKTGNDFPSDALLQEAYEKSKAQLRALKRVHVAQIFLPVTSAGDEQKNRATQQEIIRIYGEVLQKKMKFADLAKKYSQHSESAEKGGDMGWVSGDKLLPELAPLFISLAANEVYPPVRTAMGWHIFKMLEKEMAPTPSFEQVKEGLAKALRREAMQRKEQEYMENLLRQSPAKVHTELLPK